MIRKIGLVAWLALALLILGAPLLLKAEDRTIMTVTVTRRFHNGRSYIYADIKQRGPLVDEDEFYALVDAIYDRYPNAIIGVRTTHTRTPRQAIRAAELPRVSCDEDDR